MKLHILNAVNDKLRERSVLHTASPVRATRREVKKAGCGNTDTPDDKILAPRYTSMKAVRVPTVRSNGLLIAATK